MSRLAVWQAAGGMYPWVCPVCEAGDGAPRHPIGPDDPEAVEDDDGHFYIPGDVAAPLAKGEAQYDRLYECPNADLQRWVPGLVDLWRLADESIDALHRLIPSPSAGLVGAWAHLRDAVAERRHHESVEAARRAAMRQN